MIVSKLNSGTIVINLEKFNPEPNWWIALVNEPWDPFDTKEKKKNQTSWLVVLTLYYL